ncbi:dephospho-CoA kinase [Microlunatus endophyticus]|uniref:Dephospho-CoA kinase n=1 Tax=Microlunatus endophyticus TaxID=1716077 RepID=A0A917SGT2_9ACTN|nr:dephospho-CoA kinase [Microlunatus endophyticus]GGL76371.1 dephospho-CoA kinase [Microlunatus endophyticus]
MARLRIGLTGGIASGKSTVADLLAECGAVIIDSDLLAREVVEPGTDGLAGIVSRFGDQVIAGGRLDRAALGRIVFADPQARHDLEAIIHPAVRRRAAELEAAAGPDAVVVQMIPLLVETGQQNAFDAVIVVDVPERVQRDRLIARNGLSGQEADARIAAQATREQRLAAATVVIDNSTDLADLEQRVRQVYRELTGEPGC